MQDWHNGKTWSGANLLDHPHRLLTPQDALEAKGMSKVSGADCERLHRLARAATAATAATAALPLQPPSASTRNARAPWPTQTTMEFHYGKHHTAYLNNLNAQIAGKELEALKTVEEVRKRRLEQECACMQSCSVGCFAAPDCRAAVCAHGALLERR